jgi:uncharacterized protein
MRAAVSVARRLQDPLEELVKVEVDAIGKSQQRFTEPFTHRAPCSGVHPLQQDVVNVHVVLESAVTDAVNSSLIDVNTASFHRLRHVSGLNVALAREIVSYRAQHKFTSRQQLLAVPQFTAQIYEQCAGFVRIAIDLATNALDSTQVSRTVTRSGNLTLVRFTPPIIPWPRKCCSPSTRLLTASKRVRDAQLSIRN